MKTILGFNQKFRENILLKNLFFNIVTILLLLLLFEPTTKSDDYDMMNLLYGGIDGNYSPFILYINVVWGMVLNGLLTVSPNVPWYFVVQYIHIFSALTTITFVLCKKNERMYKNVGAWFQVVFLLFAGYEFYIRFTFSKTAGLLMISGYIFLLYLIESAQKQGLRYLWGIFLMFSGILIRSGMLNGITLIFLSSFVIFCYKEIKLGSNDFFHKVFKFVILVIMIYLIQFGLGKLNVYYYNNDETWSTYLENNSIRAGVVDLSIPDYDSYASEYERIGVSKNDYQMWFIRANRGDDTLLSIETYKSISKISNSIEDDIGQKMISAMKGLLKYQKTNTMFFLLCIAGLLLLLFGKKSDIGIYICVNGFCVLAYIYLYCFGRIQHHVDASLYMAGAVIVFYYIDTVKRDYNLNMKKIILIMSLILIFFINSFYNELISSSYYGTSYGKIESQKEQYEENYNKLSLLSDDENHFYVISAFETNYTYPVYNAYQKFEKGFYKNIYRANMNHVPVYQNTLEKYNIENIWSEITNSDYVYYAVSNVCLQDIPIVCTYINEHYNSNAIYKLVKSMEGIYVYRFLDEDFSIDLSQVKDGSSEILYSANVEYNENGDVIIDGYAFIDGKDSYAQNIYIQAVNKKTGEYKIYTCLQTENDEYRNNDKYSGKYSAFSTTIDKESLKAAKLKKKNVEFNLVLEVDHEIYQIPIE